MTLEEARATMPWRHQLHPTLGLYRVVDKHGNEVGLVDVLEFITAITAKLATKEPTES